MKEPKHFKFMTITLTKKQMATLDEFRKKIESNPGAYGLLATPYVSTNPNAEKVGTMMVHLVPSKQGDIIRRAIWRARKTL